MIEFCRRCRDMERGTVEADVIVWGTLFPDEAQGPRCLDCLASQLPNVSIPQLQGYAIFDLRPITRVLAEIGEAEFGVQVGERPALPGRPKAEARTTDSLMRLIHRHNGIIATYDSDPKRILSACSFLARRLLKLP